jgi:hypothetical protein
MHIAFGDLSDTNHDAWRQVTLGALVIARLSLVQATGSIPARKE